MAKSSPEKKSTVILTHVIPTLGNIQVELFEPAASIYRVFQAKEIKRLRGLLQLGQLTHIHSGAHHTRWDYIMLQLYLLKVFKESATGAGLASEVPCLGLSSGCQALQAYILLRNFGHLEGIFETERLLLEACLDNTAAKNMLLNLVPAEFKDWGESLIKDEKIFNFYQLLAIIFIAKGRESKQHRSLRKTSLHLLHKFLVESDARIEILKQRHREIRTLAYLALDLHYAPVGVELNLGSIVLAAREFGQKIFGSSMSKFQDLNSHILQYIEDTVYRSQYASWVFAEFRRKAYPKVLENLKRLRTQKSYFQYIEGLKRNVPSFKLRQPPVYTKFFWGSSSPFGKQEKAISKARQLAQRFNIDKADLILAPVPSKKPSHVYIYYPAESIKKPEEIAHRYKVMSEEVAAIIEKDNPKRRRRSIGLPYLAKEVCDSLDSMFKSIFYLLTKNEYEVILERTGLHERLSWVCSGTKTAALENMQYIFKSAPLFVGKEKQVELECVRATIEKIYGGTIAACFSNIKLYRKPQFRKQDEEYEAAEIDGAVIVTNAWHTKLIIIESKNQRSSSAASARKQLQELIDRKIIIAKPFKSGIEDIEEIPNKGAFLPIRLP